MSVEIVELPLHKFSNRQSLNQSLEPVEQGSARRTVNGELRFLAIPERRKYRTTISGSDLRTAVADGQVVGKTVTIRSGAELAAFVPAGGTSVVLERDPVDSEVYALDASGRKIAASVSARTVSIAAQAEDVWVYYRPVLTCLITAWQSDEDLNGAGANWSLTAEEV